MKTIRELYEEIRSDEELCRSFADAVAENKAADFLKNHDCGASVDELSDYILSRQGEEANNVEMLSLEALSNVTGGFPALDECLRNCFIEGKYIAWLHDFCPKCAAYFGA